MVKSNKNFLKKIFPPPVNTFNREMQALKDYIASLTGELSAAQKKNEKRLSALAAKIDVLAENQISLLAKIDVLAENQAILAAQQGSLAEKQANLVGKQDELMTQLKTSAKSFIEDANRIINAMPENRVVWDNVNERKMMRLAFGDITQSKDFKMSFLRLVRGLDADSIETIVRILRRQHIYLNTESKELDIFTRDEQAKIREIREKFETEIFKISETLYCYKNYFLPINHFEASVFYYKHGIDKLETLEQIGDKNIIDVGAFIGDSALILSPLTKGKVYSFEAVPEHYKMMLKTIELNELNNIVPVNIALSDKEKIIPIHLYGGASGNYVRKDITYGREIEVRATTLDRYVEENKLVVGMIKVDVEGSEQDFLKGAKKTICKQKPILLLSIYHHADDFFNIKPIIEDWKLGYKFKIFKPVFGNITSETLLLAEAK